MQAGGWRLELRPRRHLLLRTHCAPARVRLAGGCFVWYPAMGAQRGIRPSSRDLPERAKNKR